MIRSPRRIQVGVKPVALMFSLLLAWQGCEVRTASQEQVRQKLEDGLRPYFPRVDRKSVV